MTLFWILLYRCYWKSRVEGIWNVMLFCDIVRSSVNQIYRLHSKATSHDARDEPIQTRLIQWISGVMPQTVPLQIVAFPACYLFINICHFAYAEFEFHRTFQLTLIQSSLLFHGYRGSNLRVAPGLGMSGTIPLRPPVCLHGVNGDDFTFF
jgi:hypothetical protein